MVSAEKSDTPLHSYRALIEMCPQSRLKIFLRIGQIAENTHRVISCHQSFRQESVVDAAPQDGGAEYHASIF